MSYLRTTSGRFITTAAGVALTGGGLAVLLGGANGIAAMFLGLMLAVVFTIASVSMGTEESTTEPVMLLLIAGPFALFLYFMGLQLAAAHAPSLGYLFAALGLLALSRAAFAASPEPAPRAEEKRETSDAHAH